MSEQNASTAVSLSHIFAGLLYLAGLLTVMSGIGLAFAYSYPGGVLMIAAGVFLFPVTRRELQRRTRLTLTRMSAIGIFAVLYLASAAFTFPAFDLSQAPDLLIPFE